MPAPAPRYGDAARRPHSRDNISPKKGSGARGHPSPILSQRPSALPHEPGFIYTFAAAMGKCVTVQVKSGIEFEGTLHAPVLGSKNVHITLKNGWKIVDGEKKEMFETLVVTAGDFVQLSVRGIPFTPINRKDKSKTEEDSKTGSENADDGYVVMPVKDENDDSGFLGDIERAKVKRFQTSERELIAWDGGEPADDLLLQGNAQGWCQFSDLANAGVESTFDMDVYTSKVDPSKSRYTEEEADRIAREIEKDQKSLGTALDDSGIPDDETGDHPPKPEIFAKKTTSWADTVRKPATTKPERKDRAPKPTITSVQYTEAPKQTIPLYQSRNTVHTEKTTPNNDSFNYDAPPAWSIEQDTVPPPVFTKEPEGIFDGTGYSLPGHVEDGVDAEPAKHSSQYYGDPVWGPPTNDPVPVQTHSQQEPILDITPTSSDAVSPIGSRSAHKRNNSKIVTGLSFRDKVKANMPVQQLNPSPRTAKPIAQKSQVDPATDPVVQSPRVSRTYSGKLISNSRSTAMHSDHAGRGLPPEEALLSPHVPVMHGMYTHEPRPDVAFRMAPQPVYPPGYLPDGPYGIPMDNPHGIPQPNYPPNPGPISPRSDSAGGEGPDGGKRSKRFQLNPMAKAYKPVNTLEETNQGPDPSFVPQHHHPEYRGPPPLRPDHRPVIVQPGPPPPTQPTLQQHPKPPAQEYRAVMPQPVGPPAMPPNPPPPGAPIGPRPPFIPPSNVVTPWPSFPGTGVWHSGLGQRPGMPPGPYPVFMPSMMPPYMQEQMWSPPMPPGMDQRNVAMWTNYYNQVVPPNRRMNDPKFIGYQVQVPRGGRGPRRPPPNYQPHPPTGQPRGEM